MLTPLSLLFVALIAPAEARAAGRGLPTTACELAALTVAPDHPTLAYAFADAAVRLASDAAAYAHRAEVAAACGDPARALADYAKAIERAPAYAAYYARRSELALEAGQWREARLDAEVATELAPRRPEGWLRLADTHLAARDVDGALAALQTWETRPDRAAMTAKQRGHRHLLRAAAALVHEDLRGAQFELLASAWHDPHVAQPWFWVGQLAWSCGEEARAMAAYEAALAAEPDHAEARRQRACLRANAGDLTGAEADLDRLIERGHADAAAYHARGRLRGHTGRAAEAELDHREAVARDPMCSPYVDALVAAQLQAGRAEEAARAAVLLALCARDPESRARLYDLGAQIAHARGDTAAAAAAWGGAARECPANADYPARRGSASLSAGDWTAAAADFAAALELAPDHPTALAGQAWLRATCPREGLRNGLEAVQLARRLMGQTPSFEHQALLAAAQAEAGNYAAAVEQMRRLLGSPVLPASQRAEYERYLERFRAHQPWREVSAERASGANQ